MFAGDGNCCAYGLAAKLNADKIPYPYPSRASVWKMTEYELRGKLCRLVASSEARTRLNNNAPGDGEEANFASYIISQQNGTNFQHTATGSPGHAGVFKRLLEHDSQLLFTGESWHSLLVTSAGGDITHKHTHTRVTHTHTYVHTHTHTHTSERAHTHSDTHTHTHTHTHAFMYHSQAFMIL